LVFLTIPVATTVAQDAGIRFDVPATLPFVTVTEDSTCDDELPPQLAGRRWVDLDLPVSHWLGATGPEAVDELLVELVEVSGEAMVVDHWPRAQMASDYVGAIAVERTRDFQQGLKLDLSGGANGAVGGVHAETTMRRGETERFERVAPQQQVVSSGTIQQGRGVAFRFRRSIDLPLEGMQRIRLRLSLPETATNGLLRVECRALAGAPDSRERRRLVGGERMWVATFDATNVDARHKAERLARASLQLREAAHREMLERRSENRSALKQVERLLTASRERLPQDWLERLLSEGSDSDFGSFADRLSTPTRRSGEVYLATRRELLGSAR